MGFRQRVESRLQEEDWTYPFHYEVTRRGVCRCNFDPSHQCGTEGQSMFSWEISAHVHSLDSNSFAVDNTELLKIANSYDTTIMWKVDSCEAVCNGWINSVFALCKSKGYDLLRVKATITPNQFVDVTATWSKGEPLPQPVPVPLVGANL